MELEGCVNELLDILKREIQSYNMVSELLILEEKNLIEFNTRELAENLEKQEDVLSSIACLEKSRMQVLSRIGELSDEDPRMLSIKQLASMVTEPLKKKLLETSHVLGTIYEDVKKKKATNTMLIRQGILLVESDIRTILSAIGSPRGKNTGYTKRAKQNQCSGGVYIDGRM